VSATSVPSSPMAVRRISMPLSLVPWIRVARNDQAQRVERHHRRGGHVGKMLPEMSPENLFEPDCRAAARRDLAIDDADVAPAGAMPRPRRVGSGMPPPSKGDAG